MKLKRLAVLVVFGLMFLLPSICSATLPKEQMALGGITIRMPKDSVIAMYGQPVSVDQYGFKYGRYGTQFDINFISGLEVYGVFVSGNNGIATPAGIKVGMSYSDVIRLLGKPDWQGKGEVMYIHYEGEGESGTLVIGCKNNEVVEIRLSAPKGHC